MSYFGEVALGSSFPPFAALREQFGFVPKLFRAQALLPRVIEGEGELISAILFTNKALTRAVKECILLTLAAERGNTYCLNLHYEMLKLLGVTEQRLDHIVAETTNRQISHRQPGHPEIHIEARRERPSGHSPGHKGRSV